MEQTPIYIAGTTPAVRFAGEYLSDAGFPVTKDPQSHFRALLLDIPSFRPDGLLRGGEDPMCLLPLLARLPAVIGGNLSHSILENTTTYDLLCDEEYLARNAAITAHCAIPIAAEALSVTLDQSDPLIIGWGRIGKCLASLVRGLGADVTVCARNTKDRSILRAMGYKAVELSTVHPEQHRLVINTIPAPVHIDTETTASRRTVFLDLASQSGIPGESVIRARGLPGLHTPESSGKLIAETVLRIYKGGLT